MKFLFQETQREFNNNLRARFQHSNRMWVLERKILGFWKKIKDDGHERLFPGLTYTEEAGYKKKISSWFTGKDGVNHKYITPDEDKSMHSLRHNFINNLNQQEADLFVIKCIVGHKRKGVTEERYSEPAKNRISHARKSCTA